MKYSENYGSLRISEQQVYAVDTSCQTNESALVFDDGNVQKIHKKDNAVGVLADGFLTAAILNTWEEDLV